MNFQIEKTEKYTIIKLQCEKLDSNIAPFLKSELVILNSDGVKNIILDMQTEIIELETHCELAPLYKVNVIKDIGEISTDKIGIHEKHTKIVDSINKLRQIVGNYKQEIALKSKFKNKKPIRKSGKKSKSVKEHKSKTIKNKKVKSKNKSKKKSKSKRIL